MKCTFLITRRN